MEIGLTWITRDTLKQAADLGCRWCILHLRWAAIQPEPGLFDFSRCDPVVHEAADRGVRLVGSVVGPGRFPDGHWTWRNCRGMVPDPEAWRAFLRALVSRYRGAISHWEILTEPNCRSCNPMAYHDAAGYRDLLRLSRESIRPVDGSAQIVLGGMWLYSLTPAYLDTILDGGTPCFDIFNWHFYPFPPDRDRIPFPLWRGVLSEWADLFHRRLSEGCPIWMTEFGVPTRAEDSDILYTRTQGQIVGMTEEEQADWFSQFADVAEREWNVGLLFFNKLYDQDDPERRWGNRAGILRPDGSPKPIRDRVAAFQAKRSA